MRAALLFVVVLAWAQAFGEEDRRATQVNGYVESRTQWTRARVLGLLPTENLPQVQTLLEPNVQLKHSYSASGFAYADLSLFLQAAGNYRTLGPGGGEVGLVPEDVAAYRPLVALSEMFVNQDLRDDFNLLIGKKRIVWGSGIAFNPTDLINPPKDPTDPAYQRAGAFLARAELVKEQFALSLVASPQVTEEANGLPYRFLKYAAWSGRDRESHYLLAARLYALAADSDVNLMLFWSNRYNDDFDNKLRLGLSFSRYFFKDYELHAEALLQQGSTRYLVNGPCATDFGAAAECFVTQQAFIEQPRLHDRTVYPHVLLGTRYQFSDESQLSIEYLYQGDGMTRRQFQDLVNGLALVAEAKQTGLELNGENPFFDSESSRSVGIPQKFRFQPLTQHYAFIGFQKPRIQDDFTLSALLISNLQELSALLSPSVSWSARDWLTLTLGGLIPTPGLFAWSANVPRASSVVGENTLLPMKYRAIFQMRAFY